MKFGYSIVMYNIFDQSVVKAIYCEDIETAEEKAKAMELEWRIIGSNGDVVLKLENFDCRTNNDKTIEKCKEAIACNSHLEQKTTDSCQNAYVRQSTSENFQDSHGRQLIKNNANMMQRSIAKILG